MSNPLSKFAVGDHVRVTQKMHASYDKVGVVTDHARPRNWLVHDQPEVFIQFPNGSKPLPTQERHLILAIPPVTRTLNEMAEQSGLAAEEKADPGSLKSGDRVMVLGHVGMYGGRFGMIHSHSGAGASVQWLVRLEGNPVSMPFSEYELTLAPRKDMAEQEIDGEYDRTRGMPAAPFDNPLPNRRAVILRAAEDLVNGQRADDYGDPEENFQRIASLWSVIIGSRIDPEQVALCMAQVKIARLITSPTHQDSWIDLAGYAALGGEITERRA